MTDDIFKQKMKESLTSADFVAGVSKNKKAMAMFSYGRVSDSDICKVIVNLRILADLLSEKYHIASKNELGISEGEFEGLE